MSFTQVFRDRERRDEFWSLLRLLIEKFPEMLDGLDKVYEDDLREEDIEHYEIQRGKKYDSSSPKFMSGMVLVCQVMNLDNDESMFVISPFEQSEYLTAGLLAMADRTQ
jgi:hypothetical protein